MSTARTGDERLSPLANPLHTFTRQISLDGLLVASCNSFLDNIDFMNGKYRFAHKAIIEIRSIGPPLRASRNAAKGT